MPSGPLPRTIMLEVGASTAAFRLWNAARRPQPGDYDFRPSLRRNPRIEFTFSMTQKRFLLGAVAPHALQSLPVRPIRPPWSPHEQLALGLGLDPIGDAPRILGGMIYRSGEPSLVITDELTGHYFMNWNDDSRRELADFFALLGFAHTHTPL